MTSARPHAAGEAADARPHRVQTARDLHESLRAPDPATRLRVLKAVAAQPNLALGFGPHEGRDVIAVLLERAQTVQREPERGAILVTLCAFRDPRVTAFLVELLGTADDPQALFLAAHGLRDEPIPTLYESVLPLALQNESEARARAASRLLGRAESPGAEAAVRLALLAEEDEPLAPPVDDEHAAAWIRELRGPYQREAWDEIEAQGREAFVRLAGCWDALDEEARVRLAAWGVAEFPDAIAPLVERALDPRATPVAVAALEAVASAAASSDAPPEWPPTLQPTLVRLARHEDPQLRLAATIALRWVAAYPVDDASRSGFDWRARLREDSDPAVRCVCAERLFEEEGSGAAEDLFALLADPDPDVRTAAARLLEVVAPVGELPAD